MSYSGWAAMKKKKIVIDPMASKQRMCFLQFLRADKLKLEAPADSRSGEGPISTSGVWVLARSLCDGAGSG